MRFAELTRRQPLADDAAASRAERADLVAVIDERIVVRRDEFVSVHLTPSAYGYGPRARAA